MDIKILIKLMNCFPGSFINHNFELIVHKPTNEYICLKDCIDSFDIKCKLLEWLSRSAYKTEPYQSKKSNDKFHAFISNGINQFMETNFTESDFELIYTYLGNSCNHKKTVRFIKSGYDMELLKRE